MDLIVHIPDKAVGILPAQNGDLAREILEGYVLEGYKSGKFTAHQLGELLGLETGMEVDEFLKEHNVPLEVTVEDLKEGRKAMDRLLGK